MGHFFGPVAGAGPVAGGQPLRRSAVPAQASILRLFCHRQNSGKGEHMRQGFGSGLVQATKAINLTGTTAEASDEGQAREIPATQVTMVGPELVPDHGDRKMWWRARSRACTMSSGKCKKRCSEPLPPATDLALGCLRCCAQWRRKGLKKYLVW